MLIEAYRDLARSRPFVAINPPCHMQTHVCHDIPLMRYAMSKTTDVTFKPQQDSSMGSMDVDESSQRGRKRRRRSSIDVLASVVNHDSPGGSTNFRGRGRRRALETRSTSPSDGVSISRSDPKLQPGRKLHKRRQPAFTEPKKRSQSPSRSRSQDAVGTPTRRRQRTVSRSRHHGHKNGSKVRRDEGRKSDLQLETKGVHEDVIAYELEDQMAADAQAEA